MRGINKILLENILPAHVAEHFLATRANQVPPKLCNQTPLHVKQVLRKAKSDKFTSHSNYWYGGIDTNLFLFFDFLLFFCSLLVEISLVIPLLKIDVSHLTGASIQMFHIALKPFTPQGSAVLPIS